MPVVLNRSGRPDDPWPNLLFVVVIDSNDFVWGPADSCPWIPGLGRQKNVKKENFHLFSF